MSGNEDTQQAVSTATNKMAQSVVSNVVHNASRSAEQKLVAKGETIKEVIVVYDNDKAIKYTLPKEFNENHTFGTITWTPTPNSGGGGSVDGGSKQGGKKSRKPKSKRIRVRKTRRRKH